MKRQIKYEVKNMLYGVVVGVSLVATLILGLVGLESCKTININPNIYPTISPITDVVNDNLVNDVSKEEGYESSPLPSLSTVEDVIEKPLYIGNDYLYLLKEKEFLRDEVKSSAITEYFNNDNSKEEDSNENIQISRKKNRKFLYWLLLIFFGGGLWVLRRFLKKRKK